MSGTEERLRPVDLARLAGISAQQVRNYADDGILPPAGRTPSGHRTFGDLHRRALLTYRALGKGYGWEAARSIMDAVQGGDVPRALNVVNARHADLHEQRLALLEATGALESISRLSLGTAGLPRSGMRIGEVAARVGVRTSALRVWEAAGLLRPRRDTDGHRRFLPADVRDARMIAALRQGSYSLPQIAAVLDELHRTGSGEALRAMAAQRRSELTDRTAAMLAGSGLLHQYLADAPGRAAPAAG
ncbi:MerR family transcriptional regulator [Streptomyces sp. CAU 1734]|uniref:MerR family transcriptional regulator n=1 Tax=Streptomyces sp. CAU 1734 TaxID=3140360 RepID=UPI00326045A8